MQLMRAQLVCCRSACCFLLSFRLWLKQRRVAGDRPLKSVCSTILLERCCLLLCIRPCVRCLLAGTMPAGSLPSTHTSARRKHCISSHASMGMGGGSACVHLARLCLPSWEPRITPAQAHIGGHWRAVEGAGNAKRPSLQIGSYYRNAISKPRG
ncbi:hypothetical protein GQ54DRAFT_9395 [Martensiomyces pterosporus]|nr:hypothetical protein GQ54DRAFT_9395 [Martensiomyces pterosporus]